MSQTYTIDQQKWSNLSFFEQMGNIYSEVGRSFAAKKSHDQDRAEAAKSRAIDLFDATAKSLAKQSSPKLKELLRAKEQYLEALDADSSGADIDRYFMQFALAARLHR